MINNHKITIALVIIVALGILVGKVDSVANVFYHVSFLIVGISVGYSLVFLWEVFESYTILRGSESTRRKLLVVTMAKYYPILAKVKDRSKEIKWEIFLLFQIFIFTLTVSFFGALAFLLMVLLHIALVAFVMCEHKNKKIKGL